MAAAEADLIIGGGRAMVGRMVAGRSVTAAHPLLGAKVVREIERAASDHLGRHWASLGFTDLNDQASHPCGIHHGRPFSVFVKLSVAMDARDQLAAELSGLSLLRQRAHVATPTPIAAGIVESPAGWLLLLEALPERLAPARTRDDYAAIGRALATMHQAHDQRFGLAWLDGFFGPIPQDNRPVPSNRWADFYAERRLVPFLRAAVDSGNLLPGLAADVQRLLPRLPDLCGPEPLPSLLHGDAQQNNFLSTTSGAIVIDVCPYFGHPELDLALLGYIEPVPDEIFDAYRELRPIDQGFKHRRELWRISGYLAVIAVDGRSPFGRSFLGRLAEAVRCYE